MSDATEDRLDERLLRALGDELMRTTARRTTNPTGSVLDSSAFRILRVIEDGGPMTLLELAEALQLERSTVHRQVNAALQHGLVERGTASGRSGRPVQTTAAGREAFLHDGRLRGLLYTRAVAELGTERVASMVESLRAFNDALDAALDDDDGSHEA